MSDLSVRHLRMLQMIPALPRKITAKELHARLEAEGMAIHERSVERDLHKLSGYFALVNDGAKGAGWSWQRGTPALSLPPVSPESALTYELLHRFVAPVMPRTLLKQMEPQFAQARFELNRMQQGGQARWSRQIAVVPPAFSLLPPPLDDRVLDVAYGALLAGQRFEADYRPLNTDAARRWTINPLGLVQRGSVLYVVATLFDYDDIKHLPLHRMNRASPLDQPARTPPDFDFRQHVETEREFEMPSGRLLRLKLDVRGWLPAYLAEQRLAEDQVIKPLRGDDEWHRLTASVRESEQLFRWLLSHGAALRVVAPASLRKRISEELDRVAEAYGAL